VKEVEPQLVAQPDSVLPYVGHKINFVRTLSQPSHPHIQAEMNCAPCLINTLYLLP